MISKIRLLLALLLLLLAADAGAQQIAGQPVEEPARPVVGSYRLEIGRQSALSSYISPFSYRGTDFGVSGSWSKVLPQNPRHLAMRFEGRANYGRLLNPAGSASEIDFHANILWGLNWQKRFEGGWTVGAGGSIGAYGGLLYLMRNSNNPVSAQFAVGVGADCYASRVCRIGKLPLLVSDRVSLPLMGGFFCQEYGEPYYEIFLGNRNGLAHFGWPGNRFGIDNLLLVTLDFGRTAMEVGYRFSFQNEHANNLTTRLTNHAFVIGVVPGGIGLKDKKNEISPLF